MDRQLPDGEPKRDFLEMEASQWHLTKENPFTRIETLKVKVVYLMLLGSSLGPYPWLILKSHKSGRLSDDDDDDSKMDINHIALRMGHRLTYCLDWQLQITFVVNWIVGNMLWAGVAFIYSTRGEGSPEQE